MSHQGSKSWGHAAGVLPEADRSYRWDGEIWWLACASPRCENQVSHWTSYSYVTGRAGRVTRATRKVCEHHAEQFASKHGIPVAEEPPAPTATQTIIGEFVSGQLGAPQPWER